MRRWSPYLALAMLSLSLSPAPAPAAEPAPDARQLVAAALAHWRGTTSRFSNTMTIHRPDWERSLSVVGWSEGDRTSLMRVTAPARDAGNGTLTRDDNLWTYNPRINRIIKVPASMMGQSWMGSDFSNRDVTKSTDILYHYDHRLLGSHQRDGFTVYEVEAIPHEDAAVVWGREVMHIREDHILLEHQFWDQDGVLVKTMRALEIRELSGRSVVTVMRMGKAEVEQEWTEMRVQHVAFDLALPPNLFTLSNLRNPRQ